MTTAASGGEKMGTALVPVAGSLQSAACATLQIMPSNVVLRIAQSKSMVPKRILSPNGQDLLLETVLSMPSQETRMRMFANPLRRKCVATLVDQSSNALGVIRLP